MGGDGDKCLDRPAWGLSGEAEYRNRDRVTDYPNRSVTDDLLPMRATDTAYGWPMLCSCTLAGTTFRYRDILVFHFNIGLISLILK